MKPAEKLKGLDSHMYYTLLEYKDRYLAEFSSMFTVSSVNDLSKESLTVWMGFVLAKQVEKGYEIANKLRNSK